MTYLQRLFLVHPKYRLFCDLFLDKYWPVLPSVGTSRSLGCGEQACWSCITGEGELWRPLSRFGPSPVPFWSCPQVIYIISLNLSFLICKMESVYLSIGSWPEGTEEGRGLYCIRFEWGLKGVLALLCLKDFEKSCLSILYFESGHLPCLGSL